MSQKNFAVYLVTVLVFVFLFLCSSACAVSVEGNCYINFFPDSPFNDPNPLRESYSRVGATEDYDINAAGDVTATVATADGTSSSSALSPYYLAGHAGGRTACEIFNPVESNSWFSVTSTNLTSAVTDSIQFDVMCSPSFDLDASTQGAVTFYVGLWEGAIGDDVMLLTEKQGWELVNLGTGNDPFHVLSQTVSTDYCYSYDTMISVVTDQDYSYYVSVESEIAPIPEPGTLLLMALGGLLSRRKR